MSGLVRGGEPYLVAGYHRHLFIFARRLCCQAQEVASWPLFGWLAQLQRSIFVNRHRRHQVYQTINRIADELLAGEVMDVVPFRSALIGAVHEALRREERLVGNIRPARFSHLCRAESTIGGLGA